MRSIDNGYPKIFDTNANEFPMPIAIQDPNGFVEADGVTAMRAMTKFLWVWPEPARMEIRFMRLKHTENLIGKGKIYDQDSFVVDCTYKLRLYERLIDAPSQNLGVQELSDGFEVKGIVTPTVTIPLALWLADWIGKPLVLHLSTISDKHRLEFFFSQNDGVIEANSVVYED